MIAPPFTLHSTLYTLEGASMTKSGILIVDKPADWTSHDVVAKLRGALHIKRIGHGGTLDPMATGVLPVFIGRATRASEYCEHADKEYIAGLRLGVTTDTQDITGNTLSECEANISAEELSSVIPNFLGAQKQLPPMYSAIKVGGKKLYELARRGVDVERPARDIFIRLIDLLGMSGNDYTLRVACSKGTYIRTLCHDVGAALGCGGTMSSLRRTRAGTYTIEMAKTLDEILIAISAGDIEDILIPVDSVFSEYPDVILSDAETRRCKHGTPGGAGALRDGKYRFYGPDNEFLVFGEVIRGEIKIIKGFYEGCAVQ